MRFGFCGESYTNRSIIAESQTCLNLVPEIVESGKGKNPDKIALHKRPGLKLFTTLNNGPVRGLFKSDESGGRVIAVDRDEVYDVTAAGGSTSLGSIASGNTPVSVSFNGTQYLIISESQGYILKGTTLTQITDKDWPGGLMAVFLDGYFIILKPESQEIYISGLYEGTTYNALEFAAAEESPDDAFALLADHGFLWIFGSEKTEVFQNSGNIDFPFDRIQGAILEQGIGQASFTAAKLNNGVFFMGGSERGSGMVWRNQGFSPKRVSTHAVEFAIQNYAQINDAIAYSRQMEGHESYVLNFPTAEATWVFDTASGLWHEESYWDIAQGKHTAARAICHVYGYGKHLVGDRSSGKVYHQSHDYFNDDGDAIRWVRRAPHISNEHKRIFFSSVLFDMETGVGPGDGTDPIAMLRMSNDGGRTWGAERQGSMGKLGEYSTRLKFNRLGSSRDRVFELAGANNSKVSIADSYLDAEVGMN